MIRRTARPATTVDEHFDSLPGAVTGANVRLTAATLADYRGGTIRHTAPPALPGQWRVQLQDGGTFIRATPSQTEQAVAAGLEVRPEADFPA